MGLLIGTVFTMTNTVSACLGFTASEDNNVLVGTNMDWSRDFNVFINFFPSDEGKYGRVILDIPWPWFGDPDWFLPIQGMNDQGLFFDTYMTPSRPAVYKGKPFFESDDPEYYDYALWTYCLAKCSTVYEVLELCEQYDQYCVNNISAGQWFFADRNGDSVIIEDHENILFKEGNFQVVSNFLQSKPELGGYPCWRYDTAVSMLENMTDLSVEYFTSISNATHLTSTIYSSIYDILDMKIYLYKYYNYDSTVIFDLNEELVKGKNRYYLGSFFEPEDNQAPLKPDAPTGEETGLPGEDYRYSCKKTSDPNGDRIMYLFDWGDGTDSGWIMPQPGTLRAYHNWTDQGTYEVRVKAMDEYGRESEWSDPLSVTMPKNKPNINTIILNFLENHPIIYRLIKRFLKL